MKKVLLIDNYDSFTWNLVQILRESGPCSFEVVCNDEILPGDCSIYSHLLLSPGPGIPAESGNLLQIIEQCYTQKPMLGVCLGHQAIAEAMGGRLRRLAEPLHGQKSVIRVNDPVLFKGFPEKITVGRYHSWVVDPAYLPPMMMTTATDNLGDIMAMRHKYLPVFGVQFHPESILTPFGRQMIVNWLNTEPIAAQTNP